MDRCYEGVQDRFEIGETLHRYVLEQVVVYLRNLTTSVAQKQNELALLVLERAAVYQDALEKASAQLPAQDCLTQARLSTDYFVLRTVQVSVGLMCMLAT